MLSLNLTQPLAPHLQVTSLFSEDDNYYMTEQIEAISEKYTRFFSNEKKLEEVVSRQGRIPQSSSPYSEKLVEYVEKRIRLFLCKETGSDTALKEVVKVSSAYGISNEEIKNLISKNLALNNFIYGNIGDWSPTSEQLFENFEPADRKAIKTLLAFAFHVQRREAQILSLSSAFDLSERVAQAKGIGLDDPLPTTALDDLVMERDELQFITTKLPDNQIRPRLRVTIRESLTNLGRELGSVFHPKSLVETLDK